MDPWGIPTLHRNDSPLLSKLSRYCSVDLIVLIVFIFKFTCM